MRKNNQMLQPQVEFIRGIFPVFIAFSTTHQILTYWKDYSGAELKKLLFSPTSELTKLLLQKNFDLVIPIPQHADRSMKRGHASAFEVAQFFAELLNINIDRSIKLKEVTGIKQANLNEWERRHSENPFIWDTNELPLRCSDSKIIKILIVDDFITTGSTLEKAANVILEKIPNAEIYAASLGWKPKSSKKI